MSDALQGVLARTPALFLHRHLCDPATARLSLTQAVCFGHDNSPCFKFGGWAPFTVEAWVRPVAACQASSQVWGVMRDVVCVSVWTWLEALVPASFLLSAGSPVQGQ